MTLNEEGEVVDEDGDAIGRAETLPQEVKKGAEEAAGELPGLDALEGLKVGEDGAIKDAQGNTLGKITEGDPADLQGMELNAEGEILDEDGGESKRYSSTLATILTTIRCHRPRRSCPRSRTSARRCCRGRHTRGCPGGYGQGRGA